MRNKLLQLFTPTAFEVPLGFWLCLSLWSIECCGFPCTMPAFEEEIAQSCTSSDLDDRSIDRLVILDRLSPPFHQRHCLFRSWRRLGFKRLSKAMDEDDDVPQLSAPALLALQEFMREQGGQQADDAADGGQTHGDDDVTLLSEDWRMSQFWYDDATSACVAAEVNHLASSRPHFRVACIACPTLFVELRKRYPGISAQLYEYDRRFEKYGSKFTFYDYNLPLDVPHEHEKGFQLVVADPPYLSKECLEKTVETMRHLAADSEATPTSFMVLTGAVQETRVWELLKARPCVFRPVHRNKLGNEFMLFTNYDPVDRLGGWESSATGGQ